MVRIKYKGEELLPVKRDLVFKAVFVGDSDLELLASLLSSILEMDIKAEDMVVTNTELPPVHEVGKLSRVDIRIKTTDRKHIDVEIQLNNEHNMDKRSIFYLSKLYAEQMTVKMKFEELCPAIAINIMDFSYLPYKEYHNRYRMKNIRNHDELTDVFEINFIELPKVSKEIGHNAKDLWMQFISADNEGVLDMLAKKDPVFEKAVKKLVYVSADEQLRYELDMREKAELDYWSAMKTNYDKGIEKGIEKGRQEGREEGKLEAAKAMLADGTSPEKISKLLQIPLAEILKIKNSL